MQDFKEECSSNLRIRLSNIETAFKEKHSLDVSSLSQHYDSHIKSQMMEIKDHEKIVNKEIEVLNNAHKAKIESLENNANEEKFERSKMNDLIQALSNEIKAKDSEMRSVI